MITSPSFSLGAKELMKSISAKQVHVLESVDNRTLATRRGEIESYVNESMNRVLTHAIRETYMTKEAKEFHTEYRMSCYVLTDADIFSLIELGRQQGSMRGLS